MQRCALVLVLSATLTGTAFAQTIQVGATGVHRQDIWIGVWQSLAQQFTLTRPTNVTSIWLGIENTTGDGRTYKVSITDTLSLTGPEYWSAHSSSTQPTFNPVGLTLQPGTYYLMVQADFWGTAGNWAVGCYSSCSPIATLTETGGTVGSWHYCAGSQFESCSWGSVPIYVHNFRIEGTDATCAYSFTAGSGASLVRYCLTEGGTIAKLEGPSGQEHIGVDDSWEGYVVCTGTTPQAWDLSQSNSGFGSTSLIAGPTTTGVTLRRSSPQFQLDQAFKLDKAEKAVSITTTLTNISGAPLADVRLARAYDPDVDNGALDIELKSARGVLASDVNALTLTGITWNIGTDTAIDTAAAAACSPASAVPPALTGDASLANVTYRLGNMAAGAKKKVVFVYRLQ
jgi:hypothetical protein